MTFSIIRHRLFRIVDEAVITLKHVSGSAITNEGHDLMVSLYRADGSLLMGGVGFLHHLTSAAEACKSIIRRFEGHIREGDVFLLNDPYTAALHTSDIYLVAPIHYDGKLVAWSACFVHVYDIGAMNPGGFSPQSADIYTEGFSSPGIKIVDRGEMAQDVIDTMLNMVRSPEMVMLDLRSMIACNNVARERMQALIAKYGAETVDEAGSELIRQSETLFRARLKELPDGEWQSRQYLDVNGETATVRLTMTKTGDRLVFDFTGSSVQSRHAINCTKWASLGGLFAPLFPLLCYDITWNEGVIRPVDDDRAGRLDRELYAAGAGLGRDRRRDPVGQQRRLRHHRQDAGRERQLPRAGDRGLARQPLRHLQVRPQPEGRLLDRHPDRDFRRGGRSALLRRRRRYRRRDPQSDLAHGQRRDRRGQFPDPLSVPAPHEGFRRARDAGAAAPAANSPSSRTRRRMAASTMLSPARAPVIPMSDGLAGGFPGAPNKYVWAEGGRPALAADHPAIRSRFVGRLPADGRGRTVCALERRRRFRRPARARARTRR